MSVSAADALPVKALSPPAPDRTVLELRSVPECPVSNAIVALSYRLRDLCEHFATELHAGCECGPCVDADHLAFQLELLGGLIEGGMLPSPAREGINDVDLEGAIELGQIAVRRHSRRTESGQHRPRLWIPPAGDE